MGEGGQRTSEEEGRKLWNEAYAVYTMTPPMITFHVSHTGHEMYIGHTRLCVCLSLAAFPHYCTGCNLGE